jgi:hypothetical protein
LVDGTVRAQPQSEDGEGLEQGGLDGARRAACEIRIERFERGLDDARWRSPGWSEIAVIIA